MGRIRLAFVPHRCVVLAAIMSLLGVTPRLTRGEDVETLIHQLTSPSTLVRVSAAEKVAELGPAAVDAAPALFEALKCERIEVLFESPQIADSRQRIADALIRIGETIASDLEKGMQHENGLVRVWSAHALHRIDRERQRAQVIAVLIDALQTGSEVAGDAALVLELMGEDAALAIPALIEQLDHRELAVRCNVGHALAAIARKDQTHHLVEALRHSNPLVQVGAAFALQRADSESREDVHSAIAAALQDESRDVRRQAVWAIGQLGAVGQPLATRLMDALPKLDPNPIEYFFGGGSLGRQSTDPSIVLAATGSGTKPILIRALDSDNLRVRVIAAVALLQLDRDEGARVAPILKAARDDADQNVRFLADMSYAPIAVSESPDLDGLIQTLLASDAFGPPSPAAAQLIRRGVEAVGPLMAVLKSGNGVAAGKAGNVLAAIGPPALPALTEAMQSEDDQLRVFACTALADIGEPARPLLVQALKDDLYPVRRTARRALQSIGTPDALKAP